VPLYSSSLTYSSYSHSEHSTTSFFFYFFFYCSGAHRDLHSFPTRRSSDLDRRDPAGADLHRDVLAHQLADLVAQRRRQDVDPEIGRADRVDFVDHLVAAAVEALQRLRERERQQ